MNAQTEQLRDYVGDLVQLVSGKKDQNISTDGFRTMKSVVRHQQPSSTGNKKMLAHDTKKVHPNQVIPFDDDDFENF